MKILIVEDDESNRLLTYLELREEKSWDIITASDGQEAMTLFVKEHPDIVTLDIELPDISGSQLIREMKKNRPEMPIIMLTGYDNHPDVSEADAYIVKTLSCGEELKKSIKDLLLARSHPSLYMGQVVQDENSGQFSGKRKS
jgi:OmpR family response regulator RpaB